MSFLRNWQYHLLLACANLAVNVFTVNWSRVTYLPCSDISFSTVVRAAVVAKFVVLSILPLISFILALKVILVAKLVISGILSSVFLVLALYTLF